MGPEEIKNRQSKNLLKLRMLGLVGLMVNLRSRGTLQIFHQSSPTLSGKLLCKSQIAEHQRLTWALGGRRCPPSLRRCKSLVLHLTIVVTTCSRKNVWNFNIKFSEFLLCNSQCTCLVNFKNIRISAEKRRKLGGISITSSPSDQIIASGSIAVAEARTRFLKEKCNTLYLLMQFP